MFLTQFCFSTIFFGHATNANCIVSISLLVSHLASNIVIFPPPQRSLASYIKQYAYGNAKTEDLWAVLEEESGEPVNMLMNSWTKQKGYPVVSVAVKDHALEFEQVCL